MSAIFVHLLGSKFAKAVTARRLPRILVSGAALIAGGSAMIPSRCAADWSTVRLSGDIGLSSPTRVMRRTGQVDLTAALATTFPLDSYLAVVVEVRGYIAASLANEERVGVLAGLRYTIDWGTWIPWLSAMAGADAAFANPLPSSHAVWALGAGLEMPLGDERWWGVEVRRTGQAETAATQFLVRWTVALP